MNLPETMTYKEASKVLNCHITVIRRQIENGTIKAYKTGKVVMIDKSSAISWFLNSGKSLVKVNPRRRG